jgi:nucleotide-binding universal stress UspA family protein
MTRYVVVGVDGSEVSLAAARWAAAEAAERGLGLRVVTARPPGVPGGTAHPSPVAQMIDSAVGALALTCPGLDVSARETAGSPADVLSEAGRDAGLLVLGTRGTGGSPGPGLGPTALAAAGAARCPVALVPAARVEQVGEPGIVVGVDARDPDGAALDFAFDAALRRGARLRAVHAWRLPAPYHGALITALEEDRASWEDQEVQLLTDALRSRREKYPAVEVMPDVRLLAPADALLRTSEGADLLVVGRGPRTAPSLGAVARAVADRTGCPLVLVPRD